MHKLDFSVVLDSWLLPLQGGLATLGLALAGMTLALLIDVAGVAVRQTGIRWAAAGVKVFIEVVRNTPFLVQIFFLFFALPFVGIKLNPTVTSIIALGINGGAYAIEIIRGGVEAIPKGEVEAGAALGLSRADIFRFIVLKPALRAISPALSSQFIMLTLTSSVCSSISAFELTSLAQRVESATFRSFEVFFTITGMYLVIAWLLMSMFGAIARRYFNYPLK